MPVRPPLVTHLLKDGNKFTWGWWGGCSRGEPSRDPREPSPGWPGGPWTRQWRARSPCRSRCCGGCWGGCPRLTWGPCPGRRRGLENSMSVRIQWRQRRKGESLPLDSLEPVTGLFAWDPDILIVVWLSLLVWFNVSLMRLVCDEEREVNRFVGSVLIYWYLTCLPA